MTKGCCPPTPFMAARAPRLAVETLCFSRSEATPTRAHGPSTALTSVPARHEDGIARKRGADRVVEGLGVGYVALGRDRGGGGGGRATEQTGRERPRRDRSSPYLLPAPTSGLPDTAP